jgi:hypothetical protein
VTRRPLVLASCTVGVALVLAGCGNKSTAPSSSATPTAAPTLAPGADTYPQRDTPIGDAPAEMAATWKPYGVALIPGHSTVDPDPRWPHVTDATGGAMPAAQVAALGAAVMRVQVLATWADEHREIALLAHMVSPPFMFGPSGVALAEGTSVHSPDCSTYPAELSVHAPSPALREALVNAGESVGAGAVPVVMQFTGPCAITGTTRDGRTVSVDTVPSVRLLVLVSLQDDPVLGPIAHLDAATGCADPIAGGICGRPATG